LFSADAVTFIAEACGMQVFPPVKGCEEIMEQKQLYIMPLSHYPDDPHDLPPLLDCTLGQLESKWRADQAMPQGPFGPSIGHKVPAGVGMVLSGSNNIAPTVVVTGCENIKNNKQVGMVSKAAYRALCEAHQSEDLPVHANIIVKGAEVSRTAGLVQGKGDQMSNDACQRVFDLIHTHEGLVCAI
jgi:hypothetical protein